MLKFYLNNNKSKPGAYKKNIEKFFAPKKYYSIFYGNISPIFLYCLNFV